MKHINSNAITVKISEKLNKAARNYSDYLADTYSNEVWNKVRSKIPVEESHCFIKYVETYKF